MRARVCASLHVTVCVYASERVERFVRELQESADYMESQALPPPTSVEDTAMRRVSLAKDLLRPYGALPTEDDAAVEGGGGATARVVRREGEGRCSR